MAYDNDNIFAKILRGEAPAFKVHEDDFSLAFMDVMPQVAGHTLVIPKDPTEDIFNADPIILGHTMVTGAKGWRGGQTRLRCAWRHAGPAQREGRRANCFSPAFSHFASRWWHRFANACWRRGGLWRA